MREREGTKKCRNKYGGSWRERGSEMGNEIVEGERHKLLWREEGIEGVSGIDRWGGRDRERYRVRWKRVMTK